MAARKGISKCNIRCDPESKQITNKFVTNETGK